MQNDLLEQLRPIILPDYKVSIWPLAIGWWILIAIALLFIAGFFLLRPILNSRKQKLQVSKNALELLDRLYNECKNESDKAIALQTYLQKSNDIFKRVIHNNADLSHFSRLTGNSWIAFISAVDPGATYSKYYGDNLYAYRCHDSIHLEELHQWACQWVITISKHAKKIKPGVQGDGATST